VRESRARLHGADRPGRGAVHVLNPVCVGEHRCTGSTRKSASPGPRASSRSCPTRTLRLPRRRSPSACGQFSHDQRRHRLRRRGCFLDHHERPGGRCRRRVRRRQGYPGEHQYLMSGRQRRTGLHARHNLLPVSEATLPGRPQVRPLNSSSCRRFRAIAACPACPAFAARATAAASLRITSIPGSATS
jgi:hypothetical protein